MDRLFAYGGGHMLSSLLFAFAVIAVALATYQGIPRAMRYFAPDRRLSRWQSCLLAVIIVLGGPQLANAAYNGATNFTSFLASANTFTGAQTFGTTTTATGNLTTANLTTANLSNTNYSSFTLTTGASYAFGTGVHDVYVKKTTGSATAVTLPSAPMNGMEVYVKDAKGDAPINPITVTPASGTIDGAASFVMSANTYQGNHFHYNGTEWSVD